MMAMQVLTKPSRMDAGFCAYMRDTRAAAAVELALTFPFFALFFVLILEIALFFFATSAVEQGVFNYSRYLNQMTTLQRTKTFRDNITHEILQFVGSPLIASIKFEIGPATPGTNFGRPLQINQVDDFIADKKKPIYLRVVAERRKFTYAMFRPVWDIISNPANGGLFSPIDILVVIPWPPDYAS